jgi:subfamily B ATP-binding cassette protein MsbA
MISIFKNAESITLVRRLFKDFVRPRIRLLLSAVAFMLVLSATTSVQPLLLQQTFDKVFRGRDTNYLIILPVLIILICSIQAVANYMATRFLNKFNNRLVSDMRRALFGHIVENEIEFYSSHDSGNLIMRVTNEVIKIAGTLQIFFNAWVRQVVTSIGLVIVMFYQSWELSLVAISALAICIYPLSQFTRRVKRLSRTMTETQVGLAKRLLESFEGIRVIKAFAKEKMEVKKVGTYITDLENLTNKSMKVASFTPLMMQILGGVAIAFVIWYGGWQLMQNKMTEGNLIAFITSLLMLSKPIKSMTGSGATVTSGLVYAERLYKVLDTKPRYESRDVGETLRVDKGEVTFDHVGFEYPNGTSALHDVSFTMPAGKRTALVGHSGSGKSTILNLLLRFYEATGGTVSIDGQNILKASINSVRASISLVSQDVFIFDDTAYNNIAYGRESASQEEVFAAAKAAKCHDFILSLPQGYETKLGFFGRNLSGGQKQRIAIARAFLRNSPILIMDEATSALDPKTEAGVQESLDQLAKGRTTIVIAHRLSTVMNADQMILMDEGRISAVGRHEDLLKSSEAYRSLFGL